MNLVFRTCKHSQKHKRGAERSRKIHYRLHIGRKNNFRRVLDTKVSADISSNHYGGSENKKLNTVYKSERADHTNTCQIPMKSKNNEWPQNPSTFTRKMFVRGTIAMQKSNKRKHYMIRKHVEELINDSTSTKTF